MITWIPPHALTTDQLVLLAESLNAAPPFEARDGGLLIQAIYDKRAHAFLLPPDRLMVLETRIGADGSKRLIIVAFAGVDAIFLRRRLVSVLRQIATAWGCDMIETTCFNPRLARAIERVGGRVESVCLTLDVLDVETSDG